MHSTTPSPAAGWDQQSTSSTVLSSTCSSLHRMSSEDSEGKRSGGDFASIAFDASINSASKGSGESVEGCGQNVPAEAVIPSPYTKCCCHTPGAPTSVERRGNSSPSSATAWWERTDDGSREPGDESLPNPAWPRLCLHSGLEKIREQQNSSPIFAVEYVLPTVSCWLDQLAIQRHPLALRLTCHNWRRVQDRVGQQETRHSSLCFLAGCLWIALKLLLESCCCPTAEELCMMLGMPHLNVMAVEAILLEWLGQQPLLGFSPVEE